ncbi:pyrroline-5-carboxylate reductase [Egibacter rhizosphaerae]|uniref:Pyrroline-5-carboxylate reductase n=1 Tax=Egibacter rhizosphaerae TaxID=1670831 RepID=A0A411YGB0_9ACTN|nr:pyrroline-5-carboxylate reductase [Egibacter rhizosphaerae]QBI20258.1 pyrroline-5-carboxylate reductase [Egibacter rhizosphaerae]
MDGQLAILGTGRMGEALLSGLLRVGWVKPHQVRCSVRGAERAQYLADTYGVDARTESASAAAEADVIVLAAKPQNLGALLDEVGPKMHSGQTVISVAAGVRTRRIEAATPEDVSVVRVMSNVPVQIDEAMSVLAPGKHAADADVEVAREILGAVGRVITLPEDQLDAVTAISGSGPAYLFLLAEALIDAGILFGISRDDATDLVAQTMVGAAHMLRDQGRHPVELRESVTSPGGVTIAAIRVLEEERVRAAFINAVEAAKRRGEELASG